MVWSFHQSWERDSPSQGQCEGCVNTDDSKIVTTITKALTALFPTDSREQNEFSSLCSSQKKKPYWILQRQLTGLFSCKCLPCPPSVSHFFLTHKSKQLMRAGWRWENVMWMGWMRIRRICHSLQATMKLLMLLLHQMQ